MLQRFDRINSNYDTAEQIWFIREWLKYFNLAIPNQTTLSEFIRQIHLQNNQSCLAIDASKNINIKRYQHKLHLIKQIPDVNKQSLEYR